MVARVASVLRRSGDPGRTMHVARPASKRRRTRFRAAFAALAVTACGAGDVGSTDDGPVDARQPEADCLTPTPEWVERLEVSGVVDARAVRSETHAHAYYAAVAVDEGADTVAAVWLTDRITDEVGMLIGADANALRLAAWGREHRGGVADRADPGYRDARLCLMGAMGAP